MPRIAADSAPKYRRHKASGQAIVTLSGHDHYLGPHGTAASRTTLNGNYDPTERVFYLAHSIGGIVHL